jgi:hypothetical protein
VKFLRSRRGLAALAALLLVLFLFRPGVHELRNRITGSIGSALGRKVALDNVRIHLLPRPGFDLEGLVIYDDPAFSAEPMVRAQDVSAAIRFRPLFRGRLEIATMSAADPSINLVRNDQGRWNLASLLERSAHIPAAPTGKPASERRPAFPYLEATNARINFKIGQAKKSWALTDADVALWQDSENSWSARMKARPVRTDFNLTDTGVIQVNATWQRASSLGDTPLQVALQWQKGQLGQTTKLFSGGDRGWRGGVSLVTNFSGTPKSLDVHSQLSIEEFRRYDIMSSGVRLSAVCGSHYSTEDGVLGNLSCESPVNGGTLRLRGSLGPIRTDPAYDLTFTANKVPLASVLQLVRQTKKGLPADLAASGRLNAEVHAVSSRLGATQLTGEGAASEVRLSSNGGKDEITFGTVPLIVRNASVKHVKSAKAGLRTPDEEPTEAHLQIGPFPLGMGAPAAASAAGWVSATGYRLSLRGDTEIKSLYRLANTLGVSGFHPLAEGSARLDVGVSGTWQGFAAPQVAGTAQLRNVRTGMRGLNPPIDIASAVLKLDPETVSLDKLAAQTGDTHWAGTVIAPRRCAPDGCVFQFDLEADQLSSAGFVQWFTPRPAKRSWYQILTSSEPPGKSPLLGIRAAGRLRVNRLSFKKLDASQIVAQVNLDRGKIALNGLRGQVFQGTYLGDLIIDASAMPPHYQTSGALQNASMAQVGAAMNDAWVTGTGDGKFSLTTFGNSFSELVAHSEGELQLILRNGMLTHIELPDAAKPLPIHLFTGNLKVKSGTWKLSAGTLESHDGRYQISGTAAPGSGLNIQLTRGDEQSWNITGTLLKPRVVRASRTEARTLVKP